MATVDFTQGNLMRHVTVMSFTSSIGIMAIYLVDLMDIFFVSLLGFNEVAAAAGFASTLMFFISAISIGLSVAAGSLTAQRLGAKDLEGTRSVTVNSVMTACAVGIVIPAAMWPFLPELLAGLGATGVVSELAEGYLHIVLPASALSGMSMALVAAMRAHGDARWAMYPALLGAGVNLLFDPLLIFGLNMGLDGAAAATVLARIATFGLAYYAAVRLLDIVAWPSWASFRRDLGDIIRYAMPAVLSSIASPIALGLTTRLLSKYGTDAVAGMAIIGRLAPVVFSVVNALSSSIGPIIGQNFGAGKHDRVRVAYFDGIKFLAIYTAIAIAALWLFGDMVADLFGAEGNARRLLLFYCGPFAMINFFNGMLMVTGTSFINIGHSNWSTIMNWGKGTLGLLLFAGGGSMLFGFYGFVVGLMLNAAIFAVLAHLLALRFIQNPPEVAEGSKMAFEDEEMHIEMEMRAPVHT